MPKMTVDIAAILTNLGWVVMLGLRMLAQTTSANVTKPVTLRSFNEAIAQISAIDWLTESLSECIVED